MKALLFSALIAAVSVTPILAQTAAPAPAPVTPAPVSNPMMDRMLSSLTPDEKTQIMAARTKAMADNPGLETDEMGLMEKGMMLQSDSTTDQDREAFRAEMKAHVEKVRAAMLKADPTIQPILDKLEAQAAKMRAEAQGPQ